MILNIAKYIQANAILNKFSTILYTKLYIVYYFMTFKISERSIHFKYAKVLFNNILLIMC